MLYRDNLQNAPRSYFQVLTKSFKNSWKIVTLLSYRKIKMNSFTFDFKLFIENYDKCWTEKKNKAPQKNILRFRLKNL